MSPDYWNPNVHYYSTVLDAVPAECREALDVGCGDGQLARLIAPAAHGVTGIDLSADMVELAREKSADTANAEFREADFLADSRDALPPGRYDLVTMVAVAHHLGTERALERARRLLAPGGRLVVIGLADPGSVADWLALIAARFALPFAARRNGGKKAPPNLPTADPDTTFGEARTIAHRVLPGSRFRRRLLWRYTLTWEKPRTGTV
jgi:SAM-dependent methyltransferase